MPYARRLAIAIAAVFAASAQLAAQNAQDASQAISQPAVQSAEVTAAAPQSVELAGAAQQASLVPTVDGMRVGVHALSLGAPVPAAPRRERANRNVALMIVGGAVLIIGAVVGGTPGTIIMIGGGAVGIIGLIRSLQ